MKKVIILQRALTKYRIPFYVILKERLASLGISLELIHGLGNETDRKIGHLGTLPWAKVVKEKYFRLGGFSMIYQPYGKYLKDADLVIVQQEMKWLLNYYLLFNRKTGRLRLAFWGHGTNRKINQNSFPGKVKKYFLTKCDWWFAYTKGVAQGIIREGFTEERVTVVGNAVDTESLRALRAKVTDEQIGAFKERIGLREEGPIGLFCAAMYAQKRIPFLIEACKAIRDRIPSFQMIFVGDGPDRKFVDEAEQEHGWIISTGFLEGLDKVLCFASADVVLMPGLVGLLVLDCFALKTPLVTTQYPHHSPEIEYLQDGFNGIITEDNLESYSDVVIEILQNKKRLGVLQKGCEESSGHYTVERMAESFAEGVKSCLEQGERRTL